MERNFSDMLNTQWDDNKYMCVGLDPDVDKIEAAGFKVGRAEDMIIDFNSQVIDETADIAAAYKPNLGFYLQYLEQGGLEALRATIDYIQHRTKAPVILDCKVGDIGPTARAYARAYFGSAQLNADAVTASPYLGEDSLKSFLEYPEKGILILCHTSNPGVRETQDVHLMDGRPYYLYIAELIQKWNQNGNAGMVVGATYPDQLRQARSVMPNGFILVPGIGRQGGDLQVAVHAARDNEDQGFLINSSSGICYPDDGDRRGVALALHSQILSYL